MSLYQQMPPSALLTGTVAGVEGADTPTPRYQVQISDSNHPVPVEVYAYAAPEPYHRSGAQQYTIGDRVVIQHVGGTLAIVKHESESGPDVADTVLGYRDALVGRAATVRIGQTGVRIAGRSGETVTSLGFNEIDIVATTNSHTPSLLHVGDGGFAARGNDVGIKSIAFPVQGFAFGRNPYSDVPLHRVVVGAQTIGGTPLPLNEVPVDMSGVSVRLDDMGRPELVGLDTVKADLTEYFNFADAILVSGDGLMGRTGTPMGLPTPLNLEVSEYDLSVSLYTIRYRPPSAVSTPHIAVLYQGVRTVLGDELDDLITDGKGVWLEPHRVQFVDRIGSLTGSRGELDVLPFSIPVWRAALDAVEAERDENRRMGMPQGTLSVQEQATGRRMLTDGVLAGAAPPRTIYAPQVLFRAGDLTLRPHGSNLGGVGRYSVAEDDLYAGYMPPDGTVPVEIQLYTKWVVLLNADTGEQLTDFSVPMFDGAIIFYNRLLDLPYPVAHWT